MSPQRTLLYAILFIVVTVPIGTVLMMRFAPPSPVVASTTISPGGNTLRTVRHDGHLWVMTNDPASPPVHSPSCPCAAPASARP